VRLVALGSVLFAACGSSGGDLPSERTWASAHFDFRARPSDASACPGVLGPLEDHFAALQGSLGFAWPAGNKVVYYKFVDSSDFRAHSSCPPEAGACAGGTSVESPQSLDTHELVHAYLYPSGFPPWVLVEGAAVALSCTARFYADAKPSQTWEQLAGIQSGAVDPVSAYRSGAWLVGYLLDAFGPGPFMGVYGALPHNASTAQIDAAFQQVYGQSLAAIWAAAISEDQPRNTCVWQCSRLAIALDGGSIDTSGTCVPEIDRPFTLPSEETIYFSTSAADISLGPCGAGRVPKAGLNGSSPGGLLALYHLQAGSYYLAHSPTPGTIIGGDASTSLNTTCAVASDVAAIDRLNLYAAVPPSSAPWFLPVPPSPTGRPPSVLTDSGTATFALCASCDQTSCGAPLQGSTTTSGSFLKLTPDPTLPFSELSLFWP
jgi:hypothetical protein